MSFHNVISGSSICHLLPQMKIKKNRYFDIFEENVNVSTVFDLISEHALISGHPLFS